MALECLPTALRKWHGMIDGQLELGLGRGEETGKGLRRRPAPSVIRQKREARAVWWFARMRQVVEGAPQRGRAGL